METAIEEVAVQLPLRRDNIRSFLNRAFDKVFESFNPSEYQKRAAKSGRAFEICFEVVTRRLYPRLEFEFKPKVNLPRACLERGGGADFAVLQEGRTEGLVAVIEAKGSAHQFSISGNMVELPCPGMLRTDTVKKAMANAYQLKSVYPDCLFFIVTSHVPAGGNARCMCDLMEGKIVDKIVDITNPDQLDEMVERIRKRLSQIRQ